MLPVSALLLTINDVASAAPLLRLTINATTVTIAADTVLAVHGDIRSAYDPIKSDIWSFGFLLFEIITLERQPHCRRIIDDMEEAIAAPVRCPLHVLTVIAASMYMLLSRCRNVLTILTVLTASLCSLCSLCSLTDSEIVQLNSFGDGLADLVQRCLSYDPKKRPDVQRLCDVLDTAVSEATRHIQLATLSPGHQRIGTQRCNVKADGDHGANAEFHSMDISI